MINMSLEKSLNELRNDITDRDRRISFFGTVQYSIPTLLGVGWSLAGSEVTERMLIGKNVRKVRINFTLSVLSDAKVKVSDELVSLYEIMMNTLCLLYTSPSPRD